MKQIEVTTSGRAEFEFDMKLKDQNSKIYLYKVSSSQVHSSKFYINNKQCHPAKKKNNNNNNLKLFTFSRTVK